MDYVFINYRLKANNRRSIRNELVKLFLEEQPGTGKKELSTKYKYIVEEFEEYSIVLRRPAQLNWGFDFTVNIEGMYFKKQRRYTSPSHPDIINILSNLKIRYSHEYENIADEIVKLYNCEELDFDNVEGLYFKDGDNIERPVAILLLAIKWLFIEQDITYWNLSGRNMLMNKLEEENLVQ